MRNIEELQALVQSQQTRAPMRFKAPLGIDTDIVFIDDLQGVNSAPAILEHGYKTAKGWSSHIQCIRGVEDCIFCQNNRKGRLKIVTTVINLTGFIRKKDGQHSGPIKVPFIIDVDNVKPLLMLRQKLIDSGKSGLVGEVFTVFRTEKTSPITGSAHIPKGSIPMEELMRQAPKGIDPKEWVAPLNYEELFKLPTKAQVDAAFLEDQQAYGSGQSYGGGAPAYGAPAQYQNNGAPVYNQAPPQRNGGWNGPSHQQQYAETPINDARDVM